MARRRLELTTDPPSRIRRSVVLRGALLGVASLLWSFLPSPAPPAIAGSPGALLAQTVDADGGVVGTALRLRRLDGVKRVLLIAAHPDDEDTGLITALARGWGAEVAYLSLSRGEGGQNLIGPELDEGLGIVRTGELMAARELDGGSQFFSRAFDFGFTKSSEETFTLWPRDEILADVTWIVRKFRPQVVVSIFPPTAAAGHGQHQAAGILAGEVFDVAGDPDRFPDQLTGENAVEPWTPVKLYRSSRFDPEDATSAIETGRIDPLLGRSHHQLAMESRSQHRSQDMGAAQSPGPRSSYVTLVESRVDADGANRGIFSGVDTALVSIAADLPAGAAAPLSAAIERYRGSLRRAGELVNAFDLEASVEPLSDAVADLRGALEILDELPETDPTADDAGGASGAGGAIGVGGVDEARRVLESKLALAEEALLSAAGIVVEARTDDDLVVPGERVDLEVSAWNGGAHDLRAFRPNLVLPPGWSAEIVEDGSAAAGPTGGTGVARQADSDRAVAAGEMETWRYTVRVPEDAEISEPYYLEQPRRGEIYDWPDDRSLWGLPRNPPVVRVEMSLTVLPSSAGGNSGVPVDVRRPAEYVGVDDAMGEFRDPLLVVPDLSVLTRPEIMAWPTDESGPRTITVSVRNQARAGFAGSLTLDAPAGWNVAPASTRLDFDEPGQERSLTFELRPPRNPAPGVHRLEAAAVSDAGESFSSGFQMIDYPHIRRDLLFREAETRISMVPVEVDEDLRVGYVMGSGDSGAEALSQMGVDVELLNPEQIRDGAFRSFDVVVLGVRAYETRPDLVGVNQQLLEWVRDGGTLLVQYNRYEFSGAGYAPYPVSISRPHDRVTYETAPITLLDEDSPVFTTPNRIAQDDFEGWAQERGLYFLSEWDPRYTPLLEMSDPGEAPLRGSLLVTPLGEGLWIYTGIAFFRQFPEGVPGAYRLFANLVSLDGEAWREHHGSPDGGGGG